jgi:DnaK suppressor protein
VAAHEEALALAIRNRNREFRLIQKIEAALRRLDNHDYGYCESCGNEIGLGRLFARLTVKQRANVTPCQRPNLTPHLYG